MEVHLMFTKFLLCCDVLAGRHQYGAQTIRKIVRRMPPPVNLPSLKSESSRLGVDSGLVTPEHLGKQSIIKSMIDEIEKNLLFCQFYHISCLF